MTFGEAGGQSWISSDSHEVHAFVCVNLHLVPLGCSIYVTVNLENLTHAHTKYSYITAYLQAYEFMHQGSVSLNSYYFSPNIH